MCVKMKADVETDEFPIAISYSINGKKGDTKPIQLILTENADNASYVVYLSRKYIK